MGLNAREVPEADIRASLVRGLTAADQSTDSAARLTMRRIGPDQPHQMQGEEVGIR